MSSLRDFLVSFYLIGYSYMTELLLILFWLFLWELLCLLKEFVLILFYSNFSLKVFFIYYNKNLNSSKEIDSLWEKNWSIIFN